MNEENHVVVHVAAYQLDALAVELVAAQDEHWQVVIEEVPWLAVVELAWASENGEDASEVAAGVETVLVSEDVETAGMVVAC